MLFLVNSLSIVLVEFDFNTKGKIKTTKLKIPILGNDQSPINAIAFEKINQKNKYSIAKVIPTPMKINVGENPMVFMNTGKTRFSKARS